MSRIHSFAVLAILSITPHAILPAVAQDGAPAVPAPSLAEKWKDASVEELTAALNRLADESIQRGHAVTGLNRELEAAWADPANTSPEVEALRARLQQLEEEHHALRKALQEAIERLPATKARRAAIAKEERDVAALQAERKIVEGLLRARQPQP